MLVFTICIPTAFEGLIFSLQNMFGGGDSTVLALIYLSYLCDNHQQACTLVMPLKCNNRVLNYFGKHAMIDVFLPFHSEISFLLYMLTSRE